MGGGVFGGGRTSRGGERHLFVESVGLDGKMMTRLKMMVDNMVSMRRLWGREDLLRELEWVFAAREARAGAKISSLFGDEELGSIFFKHCASPSNITA